MNPAKVVVAGGPGAGKTTLLNELAARGYRVETDSARAIIQSRKAGGLSPRPSPAEFAEEILRIDSEKYRAASMADGPVFFERGVVDALGMLHSLGLLTAGDVAREVSRFPYLEQVFVLPPWQEIFTTDSERDQTFDDSVKVHEQCCAWYRRCGYELVEVPRDTVGNRCDFVLQALAQTESIVPSRSS